MTSSKNFKTGKGIYQEGERFRKKKVIYKELKYIDTTIQTPWN
jgi:hypothetical protein